MGAGQFPDYLQRLIRTTTKNASNGQEEETFEAGNWLWCRVEYDNGRRADDYGGTQTGADVTIHVNNTPTLVAVDRLTDGATMYHIESILPGDDELVLTAHYYDSGIDG